MKRIWVIWDADNGLYLRRFYSGGFDWVSDLHLATVYERPKAGLDVAKQRLRNVGRATADVRALPVRLQVI